MVLAFTEEAQRLKKTPSPVEGEARPRLRDLRPSAWLQDSTWHKRRGFKPKLPCLIAIQEEIS